METKQTLLEKYFPQTWNDIQLPSSIKNLLTQMQQQIGYRLMLYGTPGSGKTTTARILVNDTSKYEVMYLSGSNDFKIDTLRSKVMQFSSGFSINKKQKCVIIDECENIRNDLQDAFKIILDQCKSVNFIFITNEIEKVNPALRSRCTCLEYDFTGTNLSEQQANFIQYAINLCKSENIAYDNKGIKELYIRLFPDFRHLVVALQQMIDSKQEVTYENVLKMNDNGKQNLDLYEIIINQEFNSRQIYENTTKFKGKERECFISLGEPFFDYLNNLNLHDKTLKVAIVVSKYSDMYVTSINKFVTLMSCIVELHALFR